MFLDKEVGEMHTPLSRETFYLCQGVRLSATCGGTFAEGPLSTELPAAFASTAPLRAEDSLLSLALLA